MTDPAIIEAAARALYLSWFPGAPVDEHFQWYHDGAANPDSCVHSSNVARALKDAAVAIGQTDEDNNWEEIPFDNRDWYRELARLAMCVLVKVMPMIEAAVLERAAKVADDYVSRRDIDAGEDIAAAIRALKEQS